MARKKIQLKVLAGLTKSELRVARPAFVPEGKSYALKRAIKLLGPFPTPMPSEAELKSRAVILYFENDSEARARCMELGKGYFFNLVEEQTAPRLPEVLKNFEIIRDCSQTLASTLAHLSFAERYLLNTLWGIHPPATQERLMELRRAMGPFGPPDTPYADELTADQKLAPGELAELLNQMEQYVGRLHYIVKRRYTRKGTTKVDLGGPMNASNIVAPNPRWNLIHGAWETFIEMTARDIKLKDGNDFQQFVVCMHEWVTGDAGASFETPIKDYKAIRNGHDDSVTRLNNLRNLGTGYSPEEFDDAIRSGSNGSVPQKVLAAATQLDREIQRLDDKMKHGNRIPALSLVSG